MRTEQPFEEGPVGDAANLRAAKPDAIIRIDLPKLGESKSFRAYRYGNRFVACGRIQAASSIAKRIQLILENLT